MSSGGRVHGWIGGDIVHQPQGAVFQDDIVGSELVRTAGDHLAEVEAQELPVARQMIPEVGRSGDELPDTTHGIVFDARAAAGIPAGWQILDAGHRVANGGPAVRIVIEETGHAGAGVGERMDGREEDQEGSAIQVQVHGSVGLQPRSSPSHRERDVPGATIFWSGRRGAGLPVSRSLLRLFQGATTDGCREPSPRELGLRATKLRIYLSLCFRCSRFLRQVKEPISHGRPPQGRPAMVGSSA